MTDLSNVLHVINRAFAEYPDAATDAVINRHMLIRDALRQLVTAARKEGYTDAIRDYSDQRQAERERESS